MEQGGKSKPEDQCQQQGQHVHRVGQSSAPVAGKDCEAQDKVWLTQSHYGVLELTAGVGIHFQPAEPHTFPILTGHRDSYSPQALHVPECTYRCSHDLAGTFNMTAC